MKIKSKVIIAGLIAILLLFFGTLIYHAVSSNNTPTVKYPEGYTLINEDNAFNNEEFLEQLGFEPSAFVTYLNKNDIVSFAATIDNSRQFKLVSKTTKLTSEVVSLEETSRQGLATIGKELLGDSYEQIEYINSIPYYKIVTEVKAEGGEYVSVQYVTIRGGKYYQLTYYGTGSILSGDEKAEIADVMKTLKIPSGKSIGERFRAMSTVTIVYIVIIAAVIILAVVAIIFLTLSITRDLKIKYRTKEKGYLKIKRRK